MNADKEQYVRLEAMATFLSEIIADLLQATCTSHSYPCHAPELPRGTLSGCCKNDLYASIDAILDVV